METEERKKKKGLFAMIRESMTKTGGCCGSGESCCGPAGEKGEDAQESQKNTQK